MRKRRGATAPRRFLLGNAFLYLIDRVRRAFVKQQNNPSARNIAMLERLFMQALDNRTVGPKEGDVQGAIVVLANGDVYVKATRNVIQGETKAEQRKDITKFFAGLLEDNASLDIPTIDGDVLTITKKQTAKKARDDHKQVDGKSIKMSDAEFAVKMRAEAHIDEIAETSVRRGKDTDRKNHDFAKDGFEYRRAFFEDFDGQYYEITLSIGKNGTVATVYNVGKIEKSTLPSAKIIAGVGSKPLGKVLSDTNVAQKTPGVNTHSMQEGAGVFAEDGGNTAQGALLPPEYRPGARSEGVDPNAAVEGATTTPPSADADTSPYTGEACGA